MSALRNFSTRQTPQSEPVPGRSDQVANNAGGQVFEATPLQRLRRFLILGSEGGSFYQTEHDLTRENAQFVIDLLMDDGDHQWIVDEAVEVSVSGRAPKNDQALFVLALAASFGTDASKRYAMSRLPEVARIGTHLFQFVQYMTQFRGWGRAAREGVAAWYGAKAPLALAYDVTKYRQRADWSHRDILRLAHPTPGHGQEGIARDAIFGYVTGGKPGVPGETLMPETMDVLAYLAAVEDIKRQDSVQGVLDLIRTYRLPREVVPIGYLNDPKVWAALVETDMPMTALLRNLGKLTQVGLIKPLSEHEALIAQQLTNPEALRRARVHPITVLNALLVYRGGRGMRGSLSWTPSARIIDALDAAFYLAFGNVEPANMRTLLALDVSSSMSHPISSSAWLSCRDASAAMALVTARTEPRYATVAFSHQMVPFEFSASQRVDDVARLMSQTPFGGTDCALPMLYAERNALDVDTFIIYTDAETWYGDIHPYQALQRYRRLSGIDAHLVVVGMVGNRFTLADPTDAGMLDVVGFDAAAPGVIAAFSRREF